jgi:UDP-GlcNAc:undecaprenyl-phosphate/decaprenyl-phosphate GlcNAc-1-phosphate transferase
MRPDLAQFGAWQMLGLYGASMGLTLVLVPVLAGSAARFGLEAKAQGRRQHTGMIPLVGGLALTGGTIAALVGVLPLVRWTAGFPWWFLIAVLVMAVSGAVDDAKELSASAKALIQILTALALALTAAFRVTNLGDLVDAGPVELGAFAVPFTVLVLVGYVNALNMIDGMDGLAGGVALVQLGFLGLVAFAYHVTAVLPLVIAFGGGIIGFLAFNLPIPGRKRAAIFLGDCGTQVLGVALGCCAISVTAGPWHRGIQPMGIAWILALPVMDTLAVMVQRALTGRSLLSGDRLHLHHALVDLGMRPAAAVYTLIAVSATYAAFGFIACLVGVQDWVLAFVFVLVLLWHTSFVFAARSALARADTMALRGESDGLGRALSLTGSAASSAG